MPTQDPDQHLSNYVFPYPGKRTSVAIPGIVATAVPMENATSASRRNAAVVSEAKIGVKVINYSTMTLPSDLNFKVFEYKTSQE